MQKRFSKVPQTAVLRLGTRNLFQLLNMPKIQPSYSQYQTKTSFPPTGNVVFWTSVGQCTVGDLVRWVDSELMRMLSNTSLRSISGGPMTRSHCTRSQGRGVVLRMHIFFPHSFNTLMVLFCYTSTSRTCALFSHTRTNYLAIE